MARGLSRPSMLDSARRASRAQVARRVQRLSAPSGRTVVGVLVAYEEEPEPRAEVEVLGSTVWLGATPGGYVVGGGVHVQVDDQGRPYWVTGPTGTPVPDSVVPTTPAEGAVPIVVQPDLSIDPEARSRSTEAWDKAQQAAADAADAREWVDETGQELVARVGTAEGAIGTVEGVLEDVRSNVGRKQWSGDSFTSTLGTFTVEPVGSGRLRIAHVEGTSPVPVRYLFGSHESYEWFDGSVVVVEVPEPGTYSVFAVDDPDTTDTADATDVLVSLVVTAEMMTPDYGWADMEWPDIDWSDAEIGLDQLRDAGLLDPDVWSRLFQDVVVGGVVAATEAFIGSNAIIDNAVQARHVVASESLWAKLAAFVRVTTDMLLVGGMNLLPDPRFEDPELTAGRMSRSAATEVSGGYQTTNYFYFCPGTTAADVRRYAVPVTAGDTYRIEVPVTLTSALSTTPRLETWNASATGRTLRTVTDWTYQDGILSYTYKVPEGVAYLSPIIYRTTSYTVHPGARVTLMADSRLLVDGAVTARAMNVVHELPSGDLLRIDPDGVRVWRAGNYGPHPNIALTAGDGFRIQTDTGEGLLWIDPATGDLHNANAITTGGSITGSTINIPGAFYASPSAGVAVGGALQIYTRGTYTSTAASGFFTDPVPVAPGRTYRALYRLERDTNTGNDHHQVWVVWFNGGTEVSRRIIVGHPGAPLYDEGSVTDAAFTAPAGVTHVRLLFTRDIAPVTTRVSDIAVFEASEGNITVSGDVRGSTGVFDRIQVGGTVLEGQQVAVPTGLGGFDPAEDGIVYSVGGTCHLYGTLFRTLADVAVGNTFRQCLQLPAGFRPAYTHYTTVMNNEGQVFQAIINPAGVVSIRTPGGSQIWQQGKTMPLAMFGPFILGGQ